jgi:hypothetical protein
MQPFGIARRNGTSSRGLDEVHPLREGGNTNCIRKVTSAFNVIALILHLCEG